MKKLTIDRYLTNQIKNDLSEKMVFLDGPRQVGKTTLALSIKILEHVYFSTHYK